MQVGFYYKTFIRPRRAWPLYEKVLRSAAGLGRIDPSHRRTRALREGAPPRRRAGGRRRAGRAWRPRSRRPRRAATRRWSTRAWPWAAAWPGARRADAELRERLVAQAPRAGVEIFQPASAGGVYEGGLVPVYQGDTMHRFRAAELVIATGSIEQPLVFGGNDLPGVMLGGGARRLINQFRLVPGEQAAVVTAGDEGIEAALELAHAGVHVAAVADARDISADLRLADAGIEHLTGWRPVEAKGPGQVDRRRHRERAASAAARLRPAGDVRPQRRPDRLLSPRPAARSATTATQDRYVPDNLPDGVRVVGAAAGAAAAAGAVPSKAGNAEVQAVRLLLRGRHHQGRQPVAGRGLHLAGAVQALHDGHDGPLPGPDVPPQLGLVIAEELGLDPDAPAGRRDHRPAAALPHQLLAAGRPRLRAGQRTSTHHWHAENGGQHALGRRLEAAYDYGDARRRGRGRARVAGPDRRLHPGQADRARAGGGRVARAASTRTASAT